MIIKIMQIGNLDDHYHFQLNVNVTLSSEGQSSAQSKSLDQFSDITFGLRGEITRALSNSPKVIPDPAIDDLTVHSILFIQNHTTNDKP